MALYLSCALASANASPAASQATDPNANTPAGVLYAIPLDSARADAAPRSHAHAGTSGLGGSNGATPGGGSDSAGSGGSGSAAGGDGTSSGAASAGHSAGGTVQAHGEAAGGSPASPSSSSSSSARTSSSSAGKSGEPILVPGGTPGSLVHSANGFGSSSQVPGYNAPTSQGFGALQSGSGSGPLLAIVLSVLTLLVGMFFGAQAWRLHLRGSRAGSDYSEA
jgi:hypothetical protein